MSRPRRRAPALWSLGVVGVVGLLTACPDEPPSPPPGDGGPRGSHQPLVPGQPALEIEGAPGARFPVAGHFGFRARSSVIFEGQPAAPPYRLVFTHIFPDRSWWVNEPREQPELGRTQEYRYGRRVFFQDARSNSSVEYGGAELAHALVRAELRLATFYYPDAHPWQETAPGALTAPLAPLPDEPALGSLRVIFEADTDPDDDLPGPASFTALDAGGAPLEELAVDSWQRVEDRVWPLELRLVVWTGGAEETIWREWLEAVETRVHFIDRSFLPPDRQPELPSPEAEITPVLLPPTAQRWVPLEPAPAGQTPSARLEAARALGAEWTARLAPEVAPLKIDPTLVLELDESGQPRGLLLRLEPGTPEGEAPPGWTAQGQRKALSALVPAPLEAPEIWLATLRGRLPAGATPEAPYLRLPEPGGGDRVQLVLPFRAE